jgi:hypothetical protein
LCFSSIAAGPRATETTAQYVQRYDLTAGAFLTGGIWALLFAFVFAADGGCPTNLKKPLNSWAARPVRNSFGPMAGQLLIKGC